MKLVERDEQVHRLSPEGPLNKEKKKGNFLVTVEPWWAG
jgi:hypothetical protein